MSIYDTLADNSLEISKDLFIKIAWDSFNAGRIKLDTQGLLDRLIAHGIYIIAIEDMLVANRSASSSIDFEVYRAIMGVIGKSAMDALIKWVRGHPYSVKQLLMSNVIGEGIGYAWNMMTDTVSAPPAGGIRRVAGGSGMQTVI